MLTKNTSGSVHFYGKKLPQLVCRMSYIGRESRFNTNELVISNQGCWHTKYHYHYLLHITLDYNLCHTMSYHVISFHGSHFMSYDAFISLHCSPTSPLVILHRKHNGFEGYKCILKSFVYFTMCNSVDFCIILNMMLSAR